MNVIAAVEAIPLATRLQHPFRFGTVVRTASANVVLRLLDDAGNVGYGEACPVPQLTAETQASVVALIEGDVRSTMLGRPVEHWRPLLDELRGLLARNVFTLAAIDTALLDLAGKIRGQSITELLGGGFRNAIEVHGAVGWFEDSAQMAAAAMAQTDHLRTLKLYVGPGELDADLERLRIVREAVGGEHPFLVDVNGMWTPDEALSAGPALRDLGVTLVEQPLKPEDGEAAAEIAQAYRRHGLIVVADESIRTAPDVLDATTRAHAINIGMSKLGGLTNALGVAAVGEAAGFSVLLGGVVELGIATHASLHLGALVRRLDYPAYLLGPLEYERQITSPRIAPVDGMLAVPQGPGLGIDVDLEALAELDARNGRPGDVETVAPAVAAEHVVS